MVSIVSGRTTSLSDSQFKNALLPMLVAFAGILTDVSDVHPSNMFDAMLVKQSGSTADSSEAQFRNKLPGADLT